MNSNPRFPHNCTITRTIGETSFSDGNTELIYDGPCRRQSSDNIRTFRSGNTSIGQVNYGDYRVSMPGCVKIRKGDSVDVDYGLDKDTNATVLHPNFSSLKTKDAPDGSTEFYYNLADI